MFWKKWRHFWDSLRLGTAIIAFVHGQYQRCLDKINPNKLGADYLLIAKLLETICIQQLHGDNAALVTLKVVEKNLADGTNFDSDTREQMHRYVRRQFYSEDPENVIGEIHQMVRALFPVR